MRERAGRFFALPGGAALALAVAVAASAAGHSDAPLIRMDPSADLADVFAFVGTRYNAPGQQVLNVLVQVHPFSEPGDGPLHDRFADDALYSIHIADPATGRDLRRYGFRFSEAAPTATPGLLEPDSIFSYGVGTNSGPLVAVEGPTRNYVQRYSVEVQEPAGKKLGKPRTLSEGIPVAPPNVGARVTPHYNDAVTGLAVSGATTLAELDVYTAGAIRDLPDGAVVFAGPREDGFYADVAGLFDLLDGRIFDNDGDAADGLGQDGGGPDTLRGFNVLVYAMQIPLADLPIVPYTGFRSVASTGVGVYASVSRGNRKLKRDGTPKSSKPKRQVNRMGNPLLNQLLIPLRDKDVFNRTHPEGDAVFDAYAREPELAGLLNVAFGTSFQASGRSDLVALFLPDVLRVDTSTGPVRLPGQSGFSRLGGFGGDSLGALSSGWPNGRRPGDDVVDILLTALASGPSYALVTPAGDNVAANDQLYHQVFPYLGTPHSGAGHVH